MTITITMTFETAEDAAQAMGRLAVQEDFVVSQTVVADGLETGPVPPGRNESASAAHETRRALTSLSRRMDELGLAHVDAKKRLSRLASHCDSLGERLYNAEQRLPPEPLVGDVAGLSAVQRDLAKEFAGIPGVSVLLAGEAARVNQDWADSAPLPPADAPTDGNESLFDRFFGAVNVVVSNLTAAEAGQAHAAVEAALSGPPVLPAPPATVATPAPTAALDSNGIPWDARLHAGTKKTTADGTWRARRTPSAPKADVEADLLAGLAARPAVVPPPPGTETFAQYMARIGAMFATNPENAMAAMSAALAPCGLTHVGQLAGRADLIPEVDERFQAGVAS